MSLSGEDEITEIQDTHDRETDQESDAGAASQSAEKNQVMVFVAKLRNPTHVFEYTDDELNEFFDKNKDKEIMIMKTPANVTEFQDDQTNVQSTVDAAINATIIPPLAVSTEFCHENIVDETELKRSEERIQRLEKLLDERNKQYAELQQMYATVHAKLVSVLAEVQKQR